MRLSTASTDGRSPACGASARTKDKKTKKEGNGRVSGLPLFGRRRRGIGTEKNSSISRIHHGNASSGDSAARSDPPSAAPVDGGESDESDEYDEASSVLPGSKVLHSDRIIHSIGSRERQFIDSVLTRLHSSGFVTRNDLYCIGAILRVACEWERSFFNLPASEDGRTSTMRVGPLWWACVDRLLLRGRDDVATGDAPDGPMTLSLVKNPILDVLWDMGIDSIRGDTVGGGKGNAYDWNASGCCQCSLFPTL